MASCMRGSTTHTHWDGITNEEGQAYLHIHDCATRVDLKHLAGGHPLRHLNLHLARVGREGGAGWESTGMAHECEGHGVGEKIVPSRVVVRGRKENERVKSSVEHVNIQCVGRVMYALR